MVSSSHNFVRVNTKNESRLIASTRNNTSPDPLKTLIDLYCVRTDSSNWFNIEIFNQHENNLLQMPLRDFCKAFMVGVRGVRRNKICTHLKTNYVALFYPKYSSKPESEKYVEYCRSNLIKYRPWIGPFSTAWGGENVSDDDIKKDWEEYAESLLQQNENIPDFLRREIEALAEELRATGNTVGHNGDARTNNLTDDTSDDDNRDPHEFDWLDADDDMMVNDNNGDDEEVQIQWDRNHDWSQLEHEYDEEFLATGASTAYENLMTTATSTYVRRQLFRNQLNQNQCLIHDLVVRSTLLPSGQSSTDGGSDVGRLHILLGQGGGGKSYAIDAILTTLTSEHNFTAENYKVCATTGKAASLIGGSTLHAHKEGFGLPCGQAKYRPLTGQALADQQENFKDVKLLIVDEFSMLRQKEIYYLDERLKQIMCSSIPFGGVTVLLVGDPAQLPPVKGQTLWNQNSSNADDSRGFNVYRMFTSVVELVENNRLDRSDPDAVLFYDFLQRLRDGKNTEEDWLILRQKCSRFSKGFQRWEAEGFNSPECVNLFCTNALVKQHNFKCLTSLEKPITLIEATHTGRGHQYKPDIARSLETSLFLSVGSSVLLTNNICQLAGLCNGSTGIVKDIVYDDITSPSHLPRFIMVDFVSQYTGTTFFLGVETRRGWVPVCPVTPTWYTPSRIPGQYDERACTMFSLRLAWV